MHSVLRHLLDDCWRLYGCIEQKDFLVRLSIPILFFGDSTRYFQSPLRVITVGLNPSGIEFPREDRFARFPQAAIEGQASARPDYRRHIEAMNSYFRTKPYARWFNSYETLLNGLDSSFYGARTNTALHTDLCSPLATNPTWSKLSREQRSHLALDGIGLWHALAEYLAPDLIIVSVSLHYLFEIHFRGLTQWRVLHIVRRQNPYEVKGKWVAITSTKRALLVFGRAANTPFGTVSSADKLKIGLSVRRCWSSGPAQ